MRDRGRRARPGPWRHRDPGPTTRRRRAHHPSRRDPVRPLGRGAPAELPGGQVPLRSSSTPRPRAPTGGRTEGRCGVAASRRLGRRCAGRHPDRAGPRPSRRSRVAGGRSSTSTGTDPRPTAAGWRRRARSVPAGVCACPPRVSSPSAPVPRRRDDHDRARRQPVEPLPGPAGPGRAAPRRRRRRRPRRSTSSPPTDASSRTLISSTRANGSSSRPSASRRPARRRRHQAGAGTAGAEERRAGEPHRRLRATPTPTAAPPASPTTVAPATTTTSTPPSTSTTSTTRDR